jgi:hypothetical protein
MTLHHAQGGTVKPEAIVLDTHEEAEKRKETARRVAALLRRADEEVARWGTVSEMLAWFFALYGHMESPPAIDPSREVIQGLKVDRDERIAWLAKVKKALQHLGAENNHRYVMLIWLHYRCPVPIGDRIVDGRKLTKHSDPGVPIRELYRHAGGNVSRDQTIHEFWVGVAWLEEYAWGRGWLRERLPKRPKTGETQAISRR